MRVAVAIVDHRFALRVQAGGGVFEFRLEKVSIDIREGGRSRIGRIDDMDTPFSDRQAPRGQFEVVMQQDAAQSAELQHFASRFGALLAELRQAHAKPTHRMIEDVADGDHRRHAPFREVRSQPQRIGQIFKIHPGVGVGENGAQLGVGELFPQRVLDHRAKLPRLADDQWRVRVGDEFSCAGILEDLQRDVDNRNQQQRGRQETERSLQRKCVQQQ